MTNRFAPVPLKEPRPADGHPDTPLPQGVSGGDNWAPGASDHLIVFARVPQLGQVKTRLAASLGQQAALSAYRALLLQALENAAELADVSRWLCLTGDDAAGECAELARRHGFRLMRQSTGDLGQRMAHALQQCLASGARRAVLMGCDIPPLDATMLRQALYALVAHDTVWGPTEDGGYALVGLKQVNERLFESIDWSTERVMAQTRECLRVVGVSSFELPLLWDVDELADWQRWQAWRGQRENSP